MSEKNYKNDKVWQAEPDAEVGARSTLAADGRVVENVDRLAQLMELRPSEELGRRQPLPDDSVDSMGQDRRIDTSKVRPSDLQKVGGSDPVAGPEGCEFAPAGRVSASFIPLLVFFGGGGTACSLFTTAGNNLIAGFALGLSVVGALLLRVFLRH